MLRGPLYSYQLIAVHLQLVNRNYKPLVKKASKKFHLLSVYPIVASMAANIIRC